jgi:hypothetical protein
VKINKTEPTQALIKGNCHVTNDVLVYLVLWLSNLLEAQLLQGVKAVLVVAYFEDMSSSAKQDISSMILQNFEGLV